MSKLDEKRIAELHDKVMAFGVKKAINKPKKPVYKHKLAIFSPENKEAINKYISPFGDKKELSVDELADKINSKEAHISYSVLKDIPEPDKKDFTIEDVITEIKKRQLEMRDIKGMPLNMNDMRWHGSGGGSGLNFETAQPTANPAVWTVSNTPKYIVMNGFSYFSVDGSYTYSNNQVTINAALVPPVGSSIQSFY